jgi:hypothetical protein
VTAARSFLAGELREFCAVLDMKILRPIKAGMAA